MAMTAAQQKDAYQFFIIAFGAAPGVVYMDQLNEAYDYGMTSQEIVNVYTTKPQFTALYPNFLTNAEFATSLINNVVKDSASSAAKAEAVADIIGALNYGLTRGDVIFNVFNNLANKPETDAMWGGTVALFNKQVAVAEYYTETLLGNATDMPTLQALVSGVTATSDVSSPAAIAALLAGPVIPAVTFTLTAVADAVQEGSDVVFKLTLDKAPVEATTLNYNTATGTASSADFVSASGQVTFAVGQTVAFVTVKTVDDATAESAESFTLNVSGANLTSAVTVTATINDQADNDAAAAAAAQAAAAVIAAAEALAARTFTLTATTDAVQEGSDVVFKLTLDKAPVEATTLNYSTATGTASSADFVSASGQVTFAVGQTVAFVTIKTVDDATAESAESFALNVSGANLTSAVTVTATINDQADNDAAAAEAAAAAARAYTVTAAAASVDEGGTVVFSLDSVNGIPGTSFAYTLSGVSAADVVGGQLTGTVTLNALGKALVSVTLVADSMTEGLETLTLSVAGKSASVSVNDTSTTPTTFNLTTAIENVVGSQFDDTINANALTLNPGDVINGGDGKDTLVFSNNGARPVSVAALQVSGVEQLKATADGGGAVRFDLSGVVGLKTLIDINSTNDVSFNQLTNLVDLEVTNLTNPNTNVTVQFQDAVVSGASDTVAVELNANQALNAITIGRVGDSNGGIETVNLATLGSTNQVNTFNTDLTNLNINGTAALTITDALNDTVRTINAAADSGALTLNFVNNDLAVQGVTFTGSAGVNTITAGDASDNITGGASADVLNAAEGNNTVIGLGGADTITAGAGNDAIYGGDGADSINAGGGNNYVEGGDEAGLPGDIINAGAGNDTILGQAGADVINAGDGDNTVDGGIDNDTITAGSGRDLVFGGDGNDTINVAIGGANTETSSATIQNTVDGGSGNDTITSGDGTDILYGGDGNDTINTGLGGGQYGLTNPVAETIFGGEGDDTVNAQGGYKDIDLGDGNDIAVFAANNLNDSIVVGGLGEDTVRADDIAQVSSSDDVGSGFGAGSSGVEVLQFSTATNGALDGRLAFENTNAAGVVTYQFQGNLDGAASLTNIANNANVDFLNNGTSLGGQNVTLTNVVATGGTVNVNVVSSSLPFAPVAESLGTLNAGNNEVVNLNVANSDAIVNPVDTLTVASFTSGSAKTLNITNTIADHAGLHSGRGTAGDNVIISAFAASALKMVDASTMTGDVTALGSSFLQNVTMTGGFGNDSLVSGAGNDLLLGGDGNDTLAAGTGVDTVIGGAGNDVFQFKDSELTAADIILGGDGKDTVAITSGSVQLGDASFFKWSSVETIDLSATALNGTNTLVLGAIANERGIESVIGGNGNEKIVFVEGYANPITITLGGGNDSVNGDYFVDQLSLNDTTYAYNGQITIKANVSEVTAGDTLQGVTGSGDVLQFMADNGAANLSNVSGFDSLTVAGSSLFNNEAATITTADGTVAAGATFTVTSTTTGNLTFNGGAETDGKFNLTSSSGNDTITTGAQADTISSGAGNDIIVSGAGNDSINAGDGNDQINGGAGNDTINAGAGDDTIVGGSGFDVIDAGAGADVIVTEGGETIQVGAGDGAADVVAISATSISGGIPQATIINGWGANDMLKISTVLVTGVAQDAPSVVRAQGDILNAATDRLITLSTSAGASATTAVGVASFLQTNNLASFALGQRAVFALNDGTNTQLWLYTSDGSVNTNATEFTNIGTINGYTGTVNMAASYVFTNFDDTAFVTAGSIVNGQDGNDSITLTATGTITMTGIESVTGTAGNDTFTFNDATTASAYGNGGTDVWNMGSGQSLTIYSTGTVNGKVGTTETLTLGEGSPTLHTVTVNNVEVVVGSSQADTITFGTSAAATVTGNGGVDVVNLNAAGQTVTITTVESVVGGAGADTVILTAGQSTTISSVESVDGTLGAGNSITLAAGGQTTTINGVESVNGGAGADKVTLAAGTQTVSIDSAVESVTGGAGTDTVQLRSVNQTVTIDGIDFVQGGSGNDNVILAAGTQDVTVDAAVETVTGGVGADTVTLGGINQTLTVDGVDTVNGGAGSADVLNLAAGGQTVAIDGAVESVNGLGAGNDSVTMLNGADVKYSNVEAVVGSGDADTIRFTSATNVTVNANGGSDKVFLANGGQNAVLTGVETVVGGTGNDAVTLADNITTSVDGGLGNDKLTLAVGNNTISVADVETVNGNTGDDTVTFTTNVTATINAGGGDDTVNLFSGGQAVTVDAVETVNGGAGDDVIIFNSAALATVNAAGGNDLLVMANGGQTVLADQVETVTGGIGADTLNLANFNQTVLVSNVEVINGGNANDDITFANNTIATVNGGIGTDTVTLAAVGGTVTVIAVETVNGGAGDDLVDATGNVNAVTIVAGLGVDTLLGGNAGDTFRFAGGALTLADSVNGNGGSDTLQITSNGSAQLGQVSSIETLQLDGTNHTVSTGVFLLTDINSGIRTVNLENVAATTVTFGDQLGGAFTVTINGTDTSDVINLATDGGFFGDDNRVLVLDGGASINAGAGNDTISAAGSNAGVTFNSGTGNDVLTGSSFNDFFKFAGNALTGNDTVAGGGHAVGSFDTIELTSAGTATFTNVSAVNVIQLDVAGTYNLNSTGGMGLASINGSAINDVVTLNTSLTSVTVSGNDGFDTLNLAAGGNMVSVNTVETVNGGTGADVLTFTGAGNTTISGGATTASLSGNDTFILSGATGIQTILFGNTAANTGTGLIGDIITGFTAGAAGDVLNFDAFLTVSGTLSVGSPFVGNPGAAVDVAGSVFRLIDQNLGQDMDSAGGFTTGVGVGGEYAFIDMAFNSTAVALVANDALSGTQVEVMYLTTGGDTGGGYGLITATLVGTMTLEAAQSIYSFTAANVTF